MKRILTLILLCAGGIALAQTARQIENIEAFNRLYGYVKYFHPSDEAANLDWNAFAVYGSKEVEKCKNTSELKETLIDLFNPVAPTMQIVRSADNVSFSVKALTPPELATYKTITWQHLGIGLGNTNNAYTSARLNRKTSQPIQSAFCTITSVLPVDQYRNKEFILTAKVKLAEGPGSGHLWARVDRQNSSTGFFDNMTNNPIVDNGWRQYEIKGVIDNDGVQLFFGCFLQNKGKLFVDDINLKVREGSEWKRIYSNSFEADVSNDYPKSLFGSNSPGYKTIVTEEESSDGKKSVSITGLKEDKDVGLLFDRYCQIGEHVKKEIGSGLTIIMPLALYGNDKSTYPKANPEKLLALENQLKSLPAATTKDLFVRIGDLVITWNIFQHFYPYFKESKTDWNEALKSAIKEAYNNQTEYDFLKTLRKFTAKLKDGHVWIQDPSIKGMEDFVLPIAWEWIEDQLVITDVLNDSVPLKSGDIVTAIDGQAPAKYFEEVYRYISAATTGWLQHIASINAIKGPENSNVSLTVSNDKAQKKQVVLNRNVRIGQYYQELKNKNTDGLKKISDNIYYIHVGIASMPDIKSKMNELQQSKALICDLRGYPKNNHELIGYLLTQNDTSKNWMRIPEIIYPDQENVTGYQEMGWTMKALQPHLNAKIFFIIDGRAISYAESFLSFIEHYKLATIIGQPSAGTNGNVNPFTLPGAIQVSWTGMKVMKHDGSQHHGVGILPTVYVEKSIKGVREQKDEFLEKAIELASKVE